MLYQTPFIDGGTKLFAASKIWDKIIRMVLSKRHKNLEGLKFGRITVISPSHVHNRTLMWNCICECGKKSVVISSSLSNGSTKSCGCLAAETRVKGRVVHGRYRTIEYRSWRNMIDRCTYKKHKEYFNYGGRGIKICDSWMGEAGFQTFFNDMGSRPSKKHSLDRINNEGGYCKDNCRWVTIKEQSRNKRSNVIIEYNGRSMCLTDWAVYLGISRILLATRINRKWSIERAFTQPVQKYFARTLNKT